MVLLNMIAKLTLPVKSQPTLRTLKRVAHAPDGTFLKYCSVMVANVESNVNFSIAMRKQRCCTCAQPYASEKLSSLAMKRSTQRHCMWKSHPRKQVIEWSSPFSSFLPCESWDVRRDPTPGQRWRDRTGTGTPPPSRFPLYFHLAHCSHVRLSRSTVWSGQFGSWSETKIYNFLITAVYHGWSPGSDNRYKMWRFEILHSNKVGHCVKF